MLSSRRRATDVNCRSREQPVPPHESRPRGDREAGDDRPRASSPSSLPPRQKQLAAITGPAAEGAAGLRDLTALLWCSIDNDDSRDLDQLSVSEDAPGRARVKILVAVADVDALVKKGTPIDDHARHEHDVGLHGGADLSRCCPSGCRRT